MTVVLALKETAVLAVSTLKVLLVGWAAGGDLCSFHLVLSRDIVIWTADVWTIISIGAAGDCDLRREDSCCYERCNDDISDDGCCSVNNGTHDEQ